MVNLMAPGVEVSDGRYLDSGTSMSTPLVTGTAGLLLSINEDLSATEVRRMLLDSANPEPFAGTGAKVGRGLLDAGAASELAVSSLSVPKHPLLEATLEQGKETSFTVNVPVPESGVNALDVVICNDVSGSYSDDIATFKTRATEVVAALAENVADVYFGLATFCDFPFDPYGSAESGDTAFDLKLRLTGEGSDFYAAVDALSTNYGADGPESQLEAFYQLATGEGRDLNNDGDYDDMGDILPTNLGWRPGALRVVILATDAEFHNSDLEPDYPGAGFTETLTALTDANIMVLGLYTGSYAEADLRTVADATRGAVFPLAGDSSNMVNAITEALDLALSSVRVSIDVLNDPEGFVQNPEMLWYDNVAPGETVPFNINLLNTLEPWVGGDKTFKMIAWALVNDSGLIMRIPINVTVPGATKVLSPR